MPVNEVPLRADVCKARCWKTLESRNILDLFLMFVVDVYSQSCGKRGLD